MWLIAGLGNPGRKYARTRHNVGFMTIREIADRHGIELSEKKGYAIGRGSIEGHDILLLEPLLFMNMSGIIVHQISRKFNILPEKLIIIHDDLDMVTGRLRIRRMGSSGGHKGVDSVIQYTGTKAFIRIKIGIGREKEEPAEEYVLKKFSRRETSLIREAIQRAADAIVITVSEGVDKAMNRFN
ncbi:MAG: aminoacyl-tRNA hydrolase [Nitrospirota bacterium]